MTDYEILLDKARENNIKVIENYDMGDTRIKGLYCNGTVALNKNMETSAEKSCTLAEEIGHHCTTVGDILDQSNVWSRKQERHARLWGYNNRIGLMGIIEAAQHHCVGSFEIAEFLNVTEEHLVEAVEEYRGIYGRSIAVDNYMIRFEPALEVYEYFIVK